ncbi:ABC transporter ATP-binding protein [Benzoatithermus flavus]|uniref:ABC transporter ATP-binding protein n=1 Tax=Benzoatithermus flavus TaxID=3108223 RepID=A0ABU8XV22_9PROT
MSVLEAKGLVKRFGGFLATNDVSIGFAQGARHALIGPNGAGKTTLVNLLTGVLRPDVGTILLEGRDVTGLPPHERVRLGLVRTFQINQLFSGLTPLESILLAIAQRIDRKGDRWRPVARDDEAIREAVELLTRLDLESVMTRPTATLAYGKRRLLEVALALACRPRVLLLDEPAAGVPHGERDEILNAIALLPREVTVVLIEHDMDLVFRFAERISVLVNGALLMEGTPAEVAASRKVREVYLGESLDG